MVESYIIIFIDLVDYSKSNEPIQITFFKRFQKEVYHILYDEICDDCCIMIPTGDGMILGLKNNGQESFLNSLRILIEIFDWAEKNNYSFRSALHVGSVNVVKDVNKNKNLVGNLVNDASRMLSGGDADSIIISKDYHNVFLRDKNSKIGILNKINNEFSFMIIDEGTVVDKHSYVHNVYAITITKNEKKYGSEKPLITNFYTRIYSDDYPKKENMKKSFSGKIRSGSDIIFYGIYNKNVPYLLQEMDINEHRKVNIQIIYASDSLKDEIKIFFETDKENLNIKTKKESLEKVMNWLNNHSFRENINLELFEYTILPSFGASFLDYNTQGSGFIHISNYLRGIIPDKTPYFEVEWKTKNMQAIYKFYKEFYEKKIRPALVRIDKD